MDFVYLLMSDGGDWEDIVVYLSKESAINVSIKYPNRRVEVFIKNTTNPGYTPAYIYYKNGECFQGNE